MVFVGGLTVQRQQQHPQQLLLPVCLSLLLFLTAAVEPSFASVLDLGRTARNRIEGSGTAGEAAVVRCSFVTGNQQTGVGAPLSSFFVPASDRAMYEEGLKDYLQQIGAQPSELSVVCTPHLSTDAVSCQLCLYNEVSRDLKHVRQGQVLASLLPQCMQGSFEQALKMPHSQYHPICYPEENKAAQEGDSLKQQVTPHTGNDGSCSN
ncbi:hypothetical protein ACSSS7_000559 [Eimeria intestinalis]